MQRRGSSDERCWRTQSNCLRVIGQDTDLQFEREAHGQKVTVEQHPIEHVRTQRDGLDDVLGGPKGQRVLLGLGQAGHPPDDGHAPFDQHRHDDPDDQRADVRVRAQERGHGGAAVTQSGGRAVAATEPRHVQPGHCQRRPHPVRVGHHRVAVGRARHPVERQRGRVRRPLEVVRREAQADRLHDVHAESQPQQDRLQRRPVPAAEDAVPRRLQQLVQSDEQLHVDDGLGVFIPPVPPVLRRSALRGAYDFGRNFIARATATTRLITDTTVHSLRSEIRCNDSYVFK